MADVGTDFDKILAMVEKLGLAESAMANPDRLPHINDIAKTVLGGVESKTARQERKEKRDLCLGAGGAVFMAVIVGMLIRATPDPKQPELIDKIVTALLTAVPSALAAFFFGKSKKES